MSVRILIVIVVLLGIDFYVFQGVRVLIQHKSLTTQRAILIGYWAISALCIGNIAARPVHRVEKLAEIYPHLFLRRHCHHLPEQNLRHGIHAARRYLPVVSFAWRMDRRSFWRRFSSQTGRDFCPPGFEIQFPGPSWISCRFDSILLHDLWNAWRRHALPGAKIKPCA